MAILLSFLPASAYDFEVDGFAYTIISTGDLTVRLDQVLNKDLAVVNVPQNVEYKNKLLTVTGIGDNACSNNNMLQEVVLPETILAIGSYAFANDKYLTKVNIPASVRSIESYTFANSGIQAIMLPLSVESLGTGAFAGTPIETINLHDGIRFIGDGCFQNCHELRNITLPDSLRVIGDRAFQGCDNLEEFIIPSGVTSIGPRMLWGCEKMATLQIGRGLKGLPVYSDFSYGTKVATLGSWFSSNGQNLYLQSVRIFILDDSEEEFSIKGIYHDNMGLPLFGDMGLDYYYVGRPLVDMRSWHSDSGRSMYFDNRAPQGYGRIKKLEVSGFCNSIPFFYQEIDTLKLGPNIRSIDLGNIYKDSLVKIECQPMSPPVIKYGGKFPTKVYTDVPLYVPLGCKEAYSNAAIWRNFWNIIEVDSGSQTGIPVVSGDEDNGNLYTVYNLAGQTMFKSRVIKDIRNLQKGIYIVRSRSKTYKIII